ncbi:hypothetical protein Tcan_15545 [Toxocara canis]|uniref:Uncharacterized protein n=1 Tax=Toxocara canis TaxID=6265 RepID=A0A0B2VLW5_TOXCA|nr:hypothetical protein Tcan_15545 [Toxocara canis]
MFRKSKSKNNLRRRLRSDEEDEQLDNDDEKTASSQNGNSMSTKEMPEKVIKSSEEIAPSVVNTKPNSLLSFDDVEGDDVTDFKLRKKDQNKRIEKLTKKAKMLRKDPEVHLSDGEQHMSVIMGNIKPEQSSSDSSPRESRSTSNKVLFTF